MLIFELFDEVHHWSAEWKCQEFMQKLILYLMHVDISPDLHTLGFDMGLICDTSNVWKIWNCVWLARKIIRHMHHMQNDAVVSMWNSHEVCVIQGHNTAIALAAATAAAVKIKGRIMEQVKWHSYQLLASCRELEEKL